MIPDYVFKDLEEIKQQPKWWIPDFVKNFSFEPYSLHFLVGPRRVGKTVALELLVERLLNERWDERKIFFLSCDEIVDFKELGEVLDNYLIFKKENKINNSLIILDEITFVEDWWRAIKSRVDKGFFKNDVLIISGSASLEILGRKELFVDRRGNGRDIYLLPMKFSKFLEKVFEKKPIIKKVGERDFLDGIRANSLMDFNEEFELYRKVGGYSLAIVRELQKKIWKREVWRWIRGSLLRSGKSEKIGRDLLEFIIQNGPGPFTYRGIGKELDISPTTVINYVDFFENIFLLKRIYQVSPKGKVLKRRPFKIIFQDISFYNALLDVFNLEHNSGYYTEILVGSNLIKDYEVYYMRNSIEVDFVVNNFLIETKAGLGKKKGVFTVNKRNLIPFLATL